MSGYNRRWRSDFRNFRRDIGALPFCHFEIKTKKPLPEAYPKALLTLGDHIRKKRLDLKLLQTDVANTMNVDEMTISGWELNHYQPHPIPIPRIIDFLGYVPEDLFPATTNGQKIKRYRCFMAFPQRSLQNNCTLMNPHYGDWRTEEGSSFGRQ